MPYIPPVMLQNRIDLLEALETDLIEKAQAGFDLASVTSDVYGIFSLEELENKVLNELDKRVAVGVGYLAATPVAIDFKPGVTRNSAVSAPPEMIAFNFEVVLVVPSGVGCVDRHSSSKLLTVLRRTISGTPIAGDAGNRKWSFVREFPRPAESTDTMLLFSQVWQVALSSSSSQPLV